MTPELKLKIKLLIEAAKRDAEGKLPTREQLSLLNHLERSGQKNRIDFPVIESIDNTAARIGCPVALLKSVKKSGSKAFLTGNRVDTGILIPELFAALAKGSDLPDGITTPQNWLATENAKIKAVIRKKLEQSVMPTADAIRHANTAGALFMGELDRLIRESPPALAGLPTSGVAAWLENYVEVVRRRLQIKMQEIGK